MGPRLAWLGLIALLVAAGCVDAWASAQAAEQTEPAMAPDVRRVHERLIALSQGEGSLAELRIELLDARGLASHRSFNIESGKLDIKAWEAPGAPVIHREGRVADARVSELLQQLIAKQYWSFAGTRFVPDAPVFLFRFYYRDWEPVDFRCDMEEVSRSPSRAEIRNLFLQFASETEMKVIPAK